MTAGLQDAFLAECKRLATTVTFYMVNGFQLRGVVKGFDAFTVLVEFEQKTHLVYKHAISTISPAGNVGLANAAGPAAGSGTPGA